MLISVIIFWISLSLLFYCYFGYGLLVYAFNALSARRKKNIPVARPSSLSVTMIVAAYNEAATLESKVLNALAIDHPADRFNIIFVTDGSTDESKQILAKYPRIQHLHQATREGKTAAINRAMEYVSSDIVVFSDANAMLNEQCINNMIRHYADPRTGGVAGEKKIFVGNDRSAVGAGEGLYWRYESWLKTLDAQFNTVVGAAGELFSIRTHLYRPLDPNIILDDFMISMHVCLQDYRIAYEPNAFATEFPSLSLIDEAKRKIRISAGAYQCIWHLRPLLNPFRRPQLSFQFFSRRLLRWVVCPVMLFVLFFSNLFLLNEGALFYQWFFGAQLIFYFMALPGWLLAFYGKSPGIFTIPFYFVFMNYCLLRGFTRFMSGKHTVLWEKSARQHPQ